MIWVLLAFEKHSAEDMAIQGRSVRLLVHRAEDLLAYMDVTQGSPWYVLLPTLLPSVGMPCSGQRTVHVVAGGSFILLLAGRMYGKEVSMCSCGVGGGETRSPGPHLKVKSHMLYVCLYYLSML